MYSESSMSDQNVLHHPFSFAGGNQNMCPGEEENEQYYKSPMNFKTMNGGGGAGGFNDFSRHCFTEGKVPFKNATNDTNLPQHNFNYQGNQQHNLMP